MSTEKIKLPAFKRGAELLLKVFVGFGSPLLLLGLLEGAAYLWEQGQANGPYAWELVASRRMVWTPFTEPGAGYTLMKPNARYEWRGIPVAVNSKGLRGPEKPYEKPAGTFRILNLGDSIAMGWGVREEETYGRRLEGLLNERQPGGSRYEVINAGTPGWNLENALAYLEGEGLRYQPDVILLDVTLVKDVYGDSALLAQNRAGVIEWLRTHTYLWPFLTIQLRSMEARLEGRERIAMLDPPLEAEAYFPLDPMAERWNEVWAWIDSADQLAQASGARFGLLLFPLEQQVTDDTYSTSAQELLTARATEAGIPVVDVLPTYRKACREKTGGPCEREDRYLFADVWMHPSAYGHRLAAERIGLALGDLLQQPPTD